VIATHIKSVVCFAFLGDVHLIANIGAMMLLACIISTDTLAREEAIPVAGWVERASLLPQGLTVRAKLDTGAKTTSINAVDSVYFTRNGRRWTRFTLTDREGQTATIERPIVRVATVKRHFGDSQERPVITMAICIGPVRKTVEVTMVDRTGLNYQVLIGRNFLAGNILVDSGRTFKLMPQCPESEQ